MKSTAIEQMKAGEVEAVSRLVVSAIRKGFSGFYSSEVVDAVAQGNSVDAIRKHGPKQTNYVMHAGDRIVGMIGLKRNEIGHLFVHPREAGRGLGRMLAEFARKKIRDVGYAEMVVHASLNAIGFYNRCGFTEQARGSFAVGDDLFLDYVRMTSKAGE